jgi:hypothetical protein
MIYHKLLLCITIIAFFLLQANAEAADPLDPSQMGESMDMPLSQELINAAMKAGVITESNPLCDFLSGLKARASYFTDRLLPYLDRLFPSVRG